MFQIVEAAEAKVKDTGKNKTCLGTIEESGLAGWTGQTPKKYWGQVVNNLQQIFVESCKLLCILFRITLCSCQLFI